jgi:hypothetical protein
MKKKALLNYWVDVIAGIAFAVAAISGVVLLFAVAGGGGGYHGGRNRGYAASVPSLSRWFWKDLHDWSAVLAVIAVLGHFVLHWDWLTCMTRTLLRRGVTGTPQSAACPSTT